MFYENFGAAPDQHVHAISPVTKIQNHGGRLVKPLTARARSTSKPLIPECNKKRNTQERLEIETGFRQIHVSTRSLLRGKHTKDQRLHMCAAERMSMRGTA